MSSSNRCFLTCIQISQEAGQVVWYSHLLKNFPQFVVFYCFFSSRHVWMWVLDHKATHQRIDAFQLWCCRRLLTVLWTARSNQSILQEINPLYSLKPDAETEAPIFWPPDVKRWLIRKDPDPGKDWRQKKGTTEEEIVGWYHQLYRVEQASGVGDGQESLACCSPRGPKELDRIEQVNNSS